MKELVPIRPPRPLIALLSIVALAAGVAACGGNDNAANPSAGNGGGGSTAPGSSTEATTQVVGGRTILSLDPALRKAFDLAGVTVTPVAPAERVDGGIALPITAGRLDIDTPSGRIQHDGGIAISAAGHTLEATNLVIAPKAGKVTARLDGRRTRLFSYDPGRPRVPQQGDTIVLPGTLAFAGQAARRLDAALGVDVLEGGLSVGELTTDAKRR